MTYQQVWNLMTKRERMANNILCMCRVDADGAFVGNSIRNKILYRVAKFVLGGGRDPLDRAGYYVILLDESQLLGTPKAEIMADLYRVKSAWRGY